MSTFTILSGSEQLANYLRAELWKERWVGLLPGARQLSRELGVNHKVVESAVEQLEGEGLLLGQGPRRKKKINLTAGESKRSLRIGIVLFERDDRKIDYNLEIFHELTDAGYEPFYLSSSLSDLGMDVDRVANLVNQTEADAWVVLAGSREVLAWFAEQRAPVLALFGRWGKSKIAGVGPDKAQAYRDAVRDLLENGHRRIVLLARPQRKLPLPGVPEKAFLSELAKGEVDVGDYHFPYWKNTREDFLRCLESLFEKTPPTAILVQEMILFLALQQFLVKRGIRVPDDLSVVCADFDMNLMWCDPKVAHFRSESRVWVRHVLRWASKVEKREPYFRQIRSKTKYVEGGSVGPVPKPVR